MPEHEMTPDRGAATTPEPIPASPTDPVRRGDPPRPRPAEPAPRRRRIGHWAGNLVKGVVVLAAVGLGIAIGPFFVPQGQGQDDGPASAEAGAATVWTCSMHPQIRQPKPGKCPLCGMDLIPATSGGGEEATSLREVSISREARELLDLRVAPVERRHVTATVRMVGKVEYDETRLGDITAWVPGRLDRLFVDYTGVEVQKGDHMVSIYSPELYSAQAELIRARQAAQQRRSATAVLSAEKLLESTREKLRLWGMTEAQVAEVERNNEPSDHMTIYAPMAGIVIQKNLQEGAYVDTGTRIYTIADLSEVWVKLDAYESDLPWLRYGQEVEFATEAYPGEVFTGMVAFIDPVLNPQTRTVKVRVNVPNPSGKLKPDMFVRATVRAQVATAGRVMDPALVGKWICRMHPGVIKETAGDCDVCGMPLVRTESLGYVSAAAAANESAEPLVVPASAVLKTGTRAVVYVERPGAERPTYEGREIVLGPRAGDFYIVRSGLEEGERVVTQGNFKLDSALQIAAKPSMMNPEGGGGGGGHDHGGAMAKADPGADGRESPGVPPSVAAQLGRLRAALEAVTAALATGNRDAVRDALRAFEEKLAAVDGTKLQGHAAMLWKELAMRLSNDAVAGRWAATEERMREAIAQLSADMGRLRDRLGLTDEPGTLLAGGPFDAPAAFRAQLGRLWDAYQGAERALAGDALEPARTATDAAETALAAVDMSLVGGEAHEAWMGTRADLQKALSRMKTGADLEALRTGFDAWSAAMTAVITSFGLPESAGRVYQLHCPMAFQGRGASWLQADEQVLNPYYGTSMLTCADDVALLWDGPPAGGAGSRSPDMPQSFREQLGRLWTAYLETQDALATDDPERAKSKTRDLDEALAGVDASVLEGKAREAWDRERTSLRAAVDRMTAADDLERLRAGFALLSEEMPVIFEAFAPEIDGAAYRMHCPMAFDGRGAAWLQAGEEPRNPYFGATMLRCVDQVERIAGDARPSTVEEGGHRHD